MQILKEHFGLRTDSQHSNELAEIEGQSACFCQPVRELNFRALSRETDPALSGPTFLCPMRFRPLRRTANSVVPLKWSQLRFQG